MAKTVFVTFERDVRTPEVDAVQIDTVVFQRGKPTQVPASGLDEFLKRAPNAVFTRQAPTEELKEQAKADAEAAEREEALKETLATDGGTGADVPKDTSPAVSKAPSTSTKASK